MVEKASDPRFPHMHIDPKSSKTFVDDAEKRTEDRPALCEQASNRGYIFWSHLGKSIFVQVNVQGRPRLVFGCCVLAEEPDIRASKSKRRSMRREKSKCRRSHHLVNDPRYRLSCGLVDTLFESGESSVRRAGELFTFGLRAGRTGGTAVRNSHSDGLGLTLDERTLLEAAALLRISAVCESLLDSFGFTLAGLTPVFAVSLWVGLALAWLAPVFAVSLRSGLTLAWLAPVFAVSLWLRDSRGVGSGRHDGSHKDSGDLHIECIW
jgi:hypothetical protein